MEKPQQTTLPFQFSDPYQAKIFERLSLVSPGAAAFYKDACRMKTGNVQLDSSAHLIAHLLREIESSLRAVMLPSTYTSPEPCKKCGNKPEAHKKQIEAIFDAYHVPLDDNVRQLWNEIADHLARLAHREGLEHPRKIDGGYENFWQKMQIFLDAVLQLVEKNYSQYISTLDQILAKPQPTKGDIRTLLQHVPNNPVTLNYFFDRLTNPQWLPLLKAKDFFLNPPGLTVRDKGGVGYPFWPQITYLKNMAKESKCQNIVTEICLQVETDNLRVRADIIDVALELPADQTVRLVQKFIDWIGTFRSWIQPEGYGKLISHLASNGYGQEAVAVAKALLQIVPDPREPVEVPVGDRKKIIPQEPRALFDEHEYAVILKQDFLALVPTVGQEAVDLLCDLLRDAITLRNPGRVEPQDYSTIWHPAIENHSENDGHGVKSILVTAVRNASEQYIKSNNDKLEEVVTNFRKRKFVIFQRLALYFVRIFAGLSPELVKSSLLNKKLFNDFNLLHEYFMLVKEQFGNLAERDQRTILKWIETGADVETYKKHCEQNKFQYTQENIDKYIKTWQIERLHPIKDSLPSDWKIRYEELVKELGKPNDFMFMSVVTAGSWGPNSPKNKDELKKMSIDDLISYLKEWKPSKEIGGNSEEGLGRELIELVKADSLFFSKNADKFIGLRPTYVRNFLRGLWEVVNNSGQVDWDAVLKLCYWVVKLHEKKDDEEVQYNWHGDSGWGWSFNTVVELLQTGFREGKSEIPWKHREQAWDILEKLTHDSDPDPKNEAKDLEGSDPATLAVNTTRGDAIHAAIEYAIWCKRNLKKENVSFDDMPEVKKVLEYHLDISKDASVIIHSIYGQHLPRLTYVDEAWVKENINKIFPKGEKEHSFWSAAWASYVFFAIPYHSVYDFMQGEYLLALDFLGKIKTRKHFSTDADDQLVEHLMMLYWTGKITLADEVLKKFYAVAPEELRYAAIDFIGRTFHRAENKPKKEVIERLQKLWENRLAAVKASHIATSKELNGFGWWFTSEIFPDAWAMKQLIEALKLSEKLYPDREVVEKLLNFIPTKPEQVAEAVILLVDGDKEGWRVLSSKETIREIIEKIKHTSNHQAKEKARVLINKLIAKGYVDDYKDLLYNYY